MYFSPPSFGSRGGWNKKALYSSPFCEAPCHKFCMRCWIITQIHIFMPVPLLSTANLSAGKKEKGKHLVSFVTSKLIGVETGRVGDGCVSLRGLLRTIVLSYLLETACTVTACFGRTCLFAFDLLRAVRSAPGPQVNTHSFRIEASKAGSSCPSWSGETFNSGKWFVCFLLRLKVRQIQISI